MIRVESLTKVYGETRALEGVSFQVESGEIVGFLGPNGAGKTTTMRILACYLPPTSGSAQVDGFDVFRDSLEVRRRIGYLPESPPLYLDMTVVSYLRFCARLRGVEPARLKSRLDFVLGRCGLHDVAGRIIANLSKGYRQRVGLAQALIHDPPVLILDEPTVGLDPGQILEIRDLIRELGRDRTVILSTHILPEVQALCRRVIIISRGRIAAEDTLEALEKGQGQGTIRIRIAGSARKAIPLLEKLPGVEAVTADGDGMQVRATPGAGEIRPSLARTLVEADIELLEMEPARSSLEEIFVRVTAEDPSREVGST